MKFLALFFLLACPLLGEDIVTISGKVYREVRNPKIKDGMLLVNYVGGLARIPISDLRSPVAEKFQKQANDALLEMQQKEEVERQKQQEQVKSLEEAKLAEIRAATKSLKTVQASMRSLIGRHFNVTGNVEISSIFLGPYAKAAATHRSFKITDGVVSGFLYARKSQGGDALWAALVAEPKASLGTFLVSVPASNQVLDGSIPCLEMLDVLEALRKAPEPVVEKAAVKALEEPAKIELKSVDEIAANPAAWLGKSFLLSGTVKVGDAYTHGYEKAYGTHFCFALDDGKSSCHLFMPRKLCSPLQELLLAHPKGMKGQFQSTILKQYFAPNGPLMVEMQTFEISETK